MMINLVKSRYLATLAARGAAARSAHALPSRAGVGDIALSLSLSFSLFSSAAAPQPVYGAQRSVISCSPTKRDRSAVRSIAPTARSVSVYRQNPKPTPKRKREIICGKVQQNSFHLIVILLPSLASQRGSVLSSQGY